MAAGAGLVQPRPEEQVNIIAINGYPYGKLENPNTDRTYFGRLIEFLKPGSGCYRTFRFLEQVCRASSLVLQEMGSHMSTFFDNFASKLSLAGAMLTIPRLPSVSKAAYNAVFNPQSTGGPGATPKHDSEKRFHAVTDGLTAWCYGLSLVFVNATLKNLGDVLGFLTDLTDLSMASEDYSLAKRHLEFVNTKTNAGALQARFVETMREALLRVVKAVASVVSGALGLMVLAFGGPILPGAALLAISSISTIAALSSYFYKETVADSKIVEFFKPEQYSVPGALDENGHQLYAF